MCGIKRNILVFLLCSLSLLSGKAQQSQLSIGVRGGGQLYLFRPVDPSTSVGTSVGGVGMLDIRYAFLHSFPSWQGAIGFITGIGIGYGNAGVQKHYMDSFTNTDYLGNTIDYTTLAFCHQMNQFGRLNVPLLFAFRAGGFTLNVGPQFMLPFAAKQTLTVDEANIEAYYPAYDVSVMNELITGKLETPYQRTDAVNLPYTILLGIETGWEWPLGSNAVGIQLFADISLWSSPSTVHPTPSTNNPFISVAPITEAGSPAVVTVNGSGSMNDRLLDFGLRVYYAFGFGHSKGSNRYEPDTFEHSRDTHEHHNRHMRYWRR